MTGREDAMNDNSRSSDIFQTPAPPERRRLLRRALLLGASLPFLFGLVLLLPAGTLDWPSAWALMAVYALGMLGINLWLIANRPGLARERLMVPRTSECWDLRLLQVINILLLAIMLPLAGVDHRLGSSPAFPPAVSAAALLIFGGVFVFLIRLMAINVFFSAAARWQKDRGHATVREGPLPRRPPSGVRRHDPPIPRHPPRPGLAVGGAPGLGGRGGVRTAHGPRRPVSFGNAARLRGVRPDGSVPPDPGNLVTA
jgi:hypothetical protein